ncbi:hypothetical protein [endosymbiont GvMRE of Glomus versiforme]|uniref:hypothetical protein n=1 Tax=endosymbiont GvMRE of Glomus versiforme TaxID=2039283 RepID=UPI0011C3B56A|nr:hypothetical protein [endosymbiont GvMRE of Glomus versiforme]
MVNLGEKGKHSNKPEYLEHYDYPPGRDIHVTITTDKDEIRNADLKKNILNFKNELEKYWNDLVNGVNTKKTANQKLNEVHEIKQRDRTKTKRSRNQIIKDLNKEEAREKNSMENPQSNQKNYWPWIFGGIGTLGLTGIVVYFLTKKKKN